jgi:hypothetical protein
MAALSLVARRTGGEADRSPPSGAEVKNAWSCTFTLPLVFMKWYFVKYKDNFIFSSPRNQKLRDRNSPPLNG